MTISGIEIFKHSIPLKENFSTSLHTVKTVKNIIIKIIDDEGYEGYGEAAPNDVVTGDTFSSIQGFIEENLKSELLGERVERLAYLCNKIRESGRGNYAARAAAEIALYDLFTRRYQMPLYLLLGGWHDKIYTDMTISISSPEKMKEGARKAVKAGFNVLKLKVGKNLKEDLNRVRSISEAVDARIKLRLDANQGWNPKQAVRIIRELQAENTNIELIEQPVAAADIEGLKYVKDNVLIPIMADESLFSPEDAIRLVKEDACDQFNIKLMKSGGISSALKICYIAEAAGIECMLGCMLESKVAISAAAHLAAAKKNITRLDLDAPLLMAENLVKGGVEYEQDELKLSDRPGLGVKFIKGLQEI